MEPAARNEVVLPTHERAEVGQGAGGAWRSLCLVALALGLRVGRVHATDAHTCAHARLRTRRDRGRQHKGRAIWAERLARCTTTRARGSVV